MKPAILVLTFVASGLVAPVGAHRATAQTPDTLRIYPPAAYDLSDVTITLESRGCGIGCPIYTIEISGDGVLRFQGREHSAVVGEQTGAISRENFVALLRSLYDTDFFALASEYQWSRQMLVVEPDGGVRVLNTYFSHDLERDITVRIGDYEKRVRGHRRVPSAFLGAERRILSLPGLSDWTGVAPDPWPIFREIDITPHGTIALGAPFAQKDSLGRQTAPDLFWLPAGFGGTEGITVALDPSGLVEVLGFFYRADREWDEMVGGYHDSLGPSLGISSAEMGRCVYWEDAETRFEIFEMGDRLKRLGSIMTDRSQDGDAAECLFPGFWDRIVSAGR